MKTNIITTALLLITAACGSSQQQPTTEANSSPVTVRGLPKSLCSWVNSQYTFRDYTSDTTPPSKYASGLYWEVPGKADSKSFLLYLTIDENDVPWVTMYVDGEATQSVCPDSVEVGGATVTIESLANGYLSVLVENSDGTAAQYMGVAGQQQ